MTLKFYSRSSCDDTASQFEEASQFQEAAQVSIAWKPVYANGAECGVSSHAGNAKLSL